MNNEILIDSYYENFLKKIKNGNVYYLNSLKYIKAQYEKCNNKINNNYLGLILYNLYHTKSILVTTYYAKINDIEIEKNYLN